jgi:hypothetical protein
MPPLDPRLCPRLVAESRGLGVVDSSREQRLTYSRLIVFKATGMGEVMELLRLATVTVEQVKVSKTTKDDCVRA